MANWNGIIGEKYAKLKNIGKGLACKDRPGWRGTKGGGIGNIYNTVKTKIYILKIFVSGYTFVFGHTYFVCLFNHASSHLAFLGHI